MTYIFEDRAVFKLFCDPSVLEEPGSTLPIETRHLYEQDLAQHVARSESTGDPGILSYTVALHNHRSYDLATEAAVFLICNDPRQGSMQSIYPKIIKFL